MSRFLIPATALLLSACAGELQLPPKAGTPETPITLPGPGGVQSRFAASSEGLYTGTIDTSGDAWVYIDLDIQTQVTPADPERSSEWDFAFKAHEIKLNGGSSGAPPEGSAVKIYGDKAADGTPYPFAQITAAPTETAVDYQTDSLTAAGPLDNANNPLSTGGQPVYAMSTYPEADQTPDAITGAGDHGWYRDAGLLGSNAISPRSNVAYVLASVQCRYYKLRISGYSAGQQAFEFGEIPGPACKGGSGSSVAPLGRAVFTATSNSQKIAIDATDENAWVHIDLTAAQQVVPTDPDHDASGWDVAFKRTDIKVNGGSSGAGTVAIADGLRDSWDARTAAYTDAAKYHTDEDGALAFITYPAAERTGDAACGGINSDFGWYYYSGFCDDGEGIHHISPREVVYVVKGRDGNYWKLRMLDYYDAAGSSAHPSVEFGPVSKP